MPTKGNKETKITHDHGTSRNDSSPKHEIAKAKPSREKLREIERAVEKAKLDEARNRKK
jgi:hypothetical protein